MPKGWDIFHADRSANNIVSSFVTFSVRPAGNWLKMSKRLKWVYPFSVKGWVSHSQCALSWWWLKKIEYSEKFNSSFITLNPSFKDTLVLKIHETNSGQNTSQRFHNQYINFVFAKSSFLCHKGQGNSILFLKLFIKIRVTATSLTTFGHVVFS